MQRRLAFPRKLLKLLFFGLQRRLAFQRKLFDLLLCRNQIKPHVLANRLCFVKFNGMPSQRLGNFEACAAFNIASNQFCVPGFPVVDMLGVG